jgi:Ser/Thr protein kinase RdoA (MazF antagonist)
VYFPELECELHAAVMSWLPGRDLDVPTVPAVHELGRAMATLHRHASQWEIPAGVAFDGIEGVFMDGHNRLPGNRMIDEGAADLIERTLAVIEPSRDALVRAGTRMPIHADLHQWNVKWLRGRMSVFDFDDAGIGVPAQDVGITSYYLSSSDDLRPALLEGYESVAPVPPMTAEQFQAELAARNVILLNDVLSTATRSTRDLAQRYLGNTQARLRCYLDTGTYRMDAPGVVPLN